MCFAAYAFTNVKLLSMTVEHSQGVGVRSASSSYGWDFGVSGLCMLIGSEGFRM